MLVQASRRQRLAAVQGCSMALRTALIRVREDQCVRDLRTLCAGSLSSAALGVGKAVRCADRCQPQSVPMTGCRLQVKAGYRLRVQPSPIACGLGEPKGNILAVKTVSGTYYKVRIMFGRLVISTQRMPSFEASEHALEKLRRAAAAVASTALGCMEAQLQEMAAAGDAAALGLTYQATLDGRPWVGRHSAFVRSASVDAIADALALRQAAFVAEVRGWQAVCDLWQQWATPAPRAMHSVSGRTVGQRPRGRPRRPPSGADVAAALAVVAGPGGGKASAIAAGRTQRVANTLKLAARGRRPKASEAFLQRRLGRLVARAEVALLRDYRGCVFSCTKKEAALLRRPAAATSLSEGKLAAEPVAWQSLTKRARVYGEFVQLNGKSNRFVQDRGSAPLLCCRS